MKAWIVSFLIALISDEMPFHTTPIIPNPDNHVELNCCVLEAIVHIGMTGSRICFTCIFSMAVVLFC